MPASLTRLDSRVEAALGTSIAALHAEEARLSAQAARVLDAHRTLSKAEATVAFERIRLLICADRQRRVDDQLLADLSDQLEVLEDAATERDQAEADLLARIKELQHRPQVATVPIVVSAAPTRHR
ncbi:hypothetical protein KV557_00175 [Kitasatospora aureofaciens]|uniref:hypothetical protein n=1 Tax=Kitasatospora aureofaciens TaxID=1894 RepID=UPI001C457442|nr:hypothetical protein [Kitasatospora aureofaciens]MBV6695542.1 hypothetical protein [Kitasatospora aureofaciens]